MSGLILKTLKETLFVTLAFALGLALAEGLLAYVIPTMILPYADQFLEMKFLQPFLVGLLGEDIAGALDPSSVISLAWVDPVVFAIIWAHAIWYATRGPAGEIDRGTADFLFGLPVSRWAIYSSDSLILAVTGMIVIGAGLVGNLIASAFVDIEFHAPVFDSAVIAANLYFVYGAAAGVVYAISALSDRRGRAVGASLAIVIASFLLSFLAQLWEPMQRVRWLSILSYYRPLPIVRDEDVPYLDMLILALVGLTFWIIGGVLTARRDIRTV